MKELASETSKPCEGTFIYKNETYHGCTKIGDQNGRAWCSTKIDHLTYEHISGGNFYGFCPEDGSCSTTEEGQMIQNHAIDLESCEAVFCFFVGFLLTLLQTLPGPIFAHLIGNTYSQPFRTSSKPPSRPP